MRNNSPAHDIGIDAFWGVVLLARRASEGFGLDGPAPVRHAEQTWYGVEIVSTDASLGCCAVGI